MYLKIRWDGWKFFRLETKQGQVPVWSIHIELIYTECACVVSWVYGEFLSLFTVILILNGCGRIHTKQRTFAHVRDHIEDMFFAQYRMLCRVPECNLSTLTKEVICRQYQIGGVLLVFLISSKIL